MRCSNSVTMADHADDGDGGDVFIYMGGDQRVPRNVRYVRVHKSVKIIPARAFQHCIHLVSIEMHDGVETIGVQAFEHCRSLKRINLPSVRVIEKFAFCECIALEDVEFGNELETIGNNSFHRCTSLTKIKILKVRTIGYGAFSRCKQLTEVKLSKDLERIGPGTFTSCRDLRCIGIPLKDNLLGEHVFDDCPHILQVDIVGKTHKIISSLLLQCWRDEMNDEIHRINRTIPYTMLGKTTIVSRWMERVINRIDHYKSEHYALLKKAMTLLELALWKAKLLDDTFGEGVIGKDDARITRGQWKRARLELKQTKRTTCGANIIIPHVLSFLNDADVFPLLNQIS